MYTIEQNEHAENQDKIIQETALSQEERPSYKVIFLLAASVALMMTGYGIVAPVFGKLLPEMGAGVEVLGFMTLAFAVSQFLLAPFMGAMADRYGRRPLVLIALAGVVVTNTLFIFVHSIPLFIAIRFLEGAVTAGLLPAAMGIIADIVPERQRTRWTGIIMGSYAVGFILGPAAGGFIIDHWGFALPFVLSAILGLIAAVFAFIMVPETRPAWVRQQSQARQNKQERESLFASLPRPLHLFATLLVLDFIAVFGFAFVDPEMVFHFYNALAFSPTQFGLVVTGYGLAMLIGQLLLGQVSDRLGKKPMIVLGFLLNIALYIGLLFSHQFWPIFMTALISGLGGALVTPALSAFYLDISAAEHRSRIMGIKESAASLGGVIGPLLVALVASRITSYGVFAVASVLTLAGAVLAMFILRKGNAAAEVQA
ncbi:MFS transporter [Ktedonosporobacter rubrisoli]|uniref:MFS transporter n=1 Tax=Ktedonosporobacter rubrisoli TaxID=2509675 RepID=A0A4P6K0Q5_KTERU|nr:MFS transporter [Ktedonosporobacter rubrisoli]QBD81639.1 MFS transporter [Ktedonosporobacter rubrisoli]